MKPVVEHIKRVITDGIIITKNKIMSVFSLGAMTKESVVEYTIAEGIKAHAKVFSGLYEPMYMVATGRLGVKLSAFDEWCLRCGNIHDSTSFSELFATKFSGFRNWEDGEYMKNAQIILNCIAKAGVVRDSLKEIVVDESTTLRYGTLDERQMNDGESIQVLIPCWYQGELILEKGILK